MNDNCSLPSLCMQKPERQREVPQQKSGQLTQKTKNRKTFEIQHIATGILYMYQKS